MNAEVPDQVRDKSKEEDDEGDVEITRADIHGDLKWGLLVQKFRRLRGRLLGAWIICAGGGSVDHPTQVARVPCTLRVLSLCRRCEAQMLSSWLRRRSVKRSVQPQLATLRGVQPIPHTMWYQNSATKNIMPPNKRVRLRCRRCDSV
jgi:hypothetical protein